MRAAGIYFIYLPWLARIVRKGRIMKKLLKILLCVSILFTLIIVPAGATAAQSLGGYEITDFDVKTVISENNVYDITETINVHFFEPRHGIYRDIPVNSVMERETPNGERMDKRVASSVWDVKVEGWQYSVSGDDRTVSIKIGSPDLTVTGDQTYIISYKLGFGNDGTERFDEVYYNITGGKNMGWDEPIDRLTFQVTLPKEFDKSKLGFNTGYSGTQGYDPEVFKFEVSGNTITGSMERILNPGEGVNMRLELPQGYFAMSHLQMTDWILIGAMGVLVIIGILLFLAYGRDRKYVTTVEFYPPEGLNPAEVGFVVDGVVDNRDVVSLLVYWADKGNISITEISKRVYELKKLKELDKDSDFFERHMFEGLFRAGDTVTTAALNQKFYTTFESTKSMVKMSFAPEERRVFTRKSMKVMPWVTILAALPLIGAVVMALSRIGEGLIFALMLGIPLGFALMLPSYIIIGIMRSWRGRKNPVGSLLISLIFWAAISAVLVAVVLPNSYEKMLPWAAIAASGIISICAVFVRKRTGQGNAWMGKILGLRNFIVLAEKDRLETLVAENPSYFYNILPYAYVLGITDIWIKNFESIALQPPTWYYGQGSFTPILFAASFHNAMTTFGSHMTSSPPSSGRGGGGGGFSGGGFSGGGGGGGGGGSW